jgi:ABC-type dipeptide/oligopeptide/nickel transport system permease subunit
MPQLREPKFVAVLAFNLLGDGLRDLLDPRLRTAH